MGYKRKIVLLVLFSFWFISIRKGTLFNSTRKETPTSLSDMSDYIRKGYDVLVVDSAKASLVCPECDLVLRSAVQTQEGIRLCEPCFNIVADTPDFISRKTGIDIRGKDGKPFSFPDKAVRREVQQLRVKCKNVLFGCLWIGSLVDCFETHQKECEYQPMECPRDGCNEAFPRDMLRNHLDEGCLYRDIHCEYCNIETKPIHLKEHHDLCESKPIQCRHCEKMVPRREVEHHNRHDCSVIECTCGDVLKRGVSPGAEDSVESHLKEPISIVQHLVFFASLLNSITKDHRDMDRRLKRIETEGSKPSNDLAQQEELVQFKAKIDERFHAVESQIMHLEQYQSGASKDKNMSEKVKDILHKLKQIESKNQQQEILVRSLQTQIQQHAVSASLATTSESFNNVDQSRIGQLEKRYEDMERQVSLLKVHVSELELQLQASLASTHNGSFLWRIPDVKRRKRDAIEERITSIYSPPFYTGRNGYKMCIRSYLNGDGIGYQTHLSLFFVVMKGEFDALLKWPFDYKVSLILVDQNHRKHIVQTFKPTPESSSFQRPVSDMNVASGCPKFADLSVLEENADNTHVKDDVMFVKCIIDTSRIFHP